MIKQYMQNLFKVLLPIIITSICLFLCFKLSGLFWPFLVAYIIAMSVSPLIDWFDNTCKIKPKYMSLIFIAIILGSIVLFIGYAVTVIGNWIPDLVGMIYNTLNHLKTLDLPFGIDFSAMLDSATANMDKIVEYVTSITGNPTSIIKTIPDLIFKLVITILASYFLIADRKRIGRFVYSILSEDNRNRLDTVLNETKNIINAFIVSQVKLMAGVVVILTIGFVLLKFDIGFIIPMVVVLGFLDFLPIIGSGTVLTPWGIICILIGDVSLGIKLLLIYAAVFAFRQFASPKIVGNEMGFSPFMSLVIMYIGYLACGLLGVFISMPIGMLIINLYKKHFFDSFLYDIKSLINLTKTIMQN
ncbi:AI-2E family transporter [Thomasclavelia cocleata]|uniref:AI-2E family transporter n=1 Tax=Thomasclavelia cocleata TaxID=69824 RepID=UPI003365A051